ncbi:MAG: hypothetical protein AB2806_20390, partial [Candidatus Thiodiazotropha sp.]
MKSKIAYSLFTKIQKENGRNKWVPEFSSEELDCYDLLKQLKDLSESNETTDDEESDFDRLLSKIMANDPWIYKEILEKTGKLETFADVHEQMRSYIINIAYNSSRKYAARKKLIDRFI